VLGPPLSQRSPKFLFSLLFEHACLSLLYTALSKVLIFNALLATMTIAAQTVAFIK
jgi:hypothetical protein